MRTSVSFSVLAAALALALASGCTPASYYYNFDITDPGARNLTKPGERDVYDTPEYRAELLVDPANFESVLLVLTNYTTQPIEVQWSQVTIVGPDQIAHTIHPDDVVARLEPNTKVRARLITFSLPTLGAAATSYDQAMFELLVPMWVKGKQQDLRMHLRAHAMKL
ncbi:MAG: hypothetical protein U0228_06455 [Myxococcaceae bacterium]